MRLGISRVDALALIAAGAVFALFGGSMVLADPSRRNERLTESLSNLRAIGAAMLQYRADNSGRVPLEFTTITRRSDRERDMAGVCGWQFGGKNNSSWWYRNGRAFDVEAADRPLNPYLYPAYQFTAPVPPARLAEDDPARFSQQAKVFQDPADQNGRARNWPAPNNPVTTAYDDIGTSYLLNTVWIEVLGGGSTVSYRMYQEAVRRFRLDEGVDPDRFIYLSDEVGDLVLKSSSSNYRILGNHGGDNTSVVLFADGHAGLITARPGLTRDSIWNSEYAASFESFGRTSMGKPSPRSATTAR